MSRRRYVSLFVRSCAVLCLCLPLNAATEPVTLTDQHPVATMTLDPKVIATGSPILEVDVTDLSNPLQLPIGIAVFITSGNLKIPVGNFAFYPAGNKGNFLLDSHTALSRVKNSQNARLVFELRKLRPSATWKPVRVTIAPPKWRTQ